MRFAVYLVAILAVAGLVYVISQPAADEASQAATPAATDTSESAVAASGVEGAEKLVTLSVPEMHCAFGCYPTVKKTLEEQPGVLAVDLADQKEEGVLDKREVHVKVAGAFDIDSAIHSLSQAGFEKSSVVQ